MKTLTAFSIFFIAALLCGFAGRAADEPWIDKTKTITRTYPLNTNQRVSITNTFGRVNVSSWNRNEVKVQITIKVSSNSETMAKQLLEQIWIDEGNGNEISFETKVGANGSNSNRIKNKNSDSKMEINYEVQLPAHTPLFVKNSFGKTYIPSRSGKTILEQSFGDLEIGSLSNLPEISVQFGKLIAEGLENSNAVFKYSNIKIGNLSGKINSSFEFCSTPRLGFSRNLQEIKIKNAYSDITIDIPEVFNAAFDIKTSFGDMLNKTNISFNDETEKKKYTPSFDKKFSGQSGSGKTKVIINSSFGKITLNNK